MENEECRDERGHPGHAYLVCDDPVVYCLRCGGPPMTHDEFWDDMSGANR